MEVYEKEKFAELLMTMGELFDKKISEPLIVLYWNALKQFKFKEFELAVNNIVQTKTFNKFPLPAEFIEYISPQATTEAIAIDAIDQVMQKMEHAGAYTTIEFDDPVIHQVIDHLGGWVYVCTEASKMDDRDFRFRKKEFERVYKAFAIRKYTGKSKLIGLFEQTNIDKGLLIDGKLTLPSGKVVYQLPDGSIGAEVPQIEAGEDVKEIENKDQRLTPDERSEP